MYPDLFGIKDFSYSLMMVLGFITAFLVVFLFLKKRCKIDTLDFAIVVIITLIVGIISAILFENLYEAIKHAINGEKQSFTWGMTFIGGLVGGVIAFVLMHKFYYQKAHESILKDVLIIAPSAICFAHAFGRIGCYLAGCCYGKATDSWIGVMFPGMTQKVIPTQLIEMIFLLILGLILLFLALKKVSKYQMPIYMLSYGIFRFIIEFYRGDERGQIGVLSPSQYWCLILIIGSIVLAIFYGKVMYKRKNKHEI